MEETYNYYIVALSVMIAILASYSSLNIAFKRKEGVENWEHIESLTQLGCNVMQGYYYGKPMSIEKIDEWVKVKMFQQIKQYTKDGYESECDINE